MAEEEVKETAAFIEWANANGINTDDEEDWRPWWDCWYDGYDKGSNAAQNKGEKQ